MTNRVQLVVLKYGIKKFYILLIYLVDCLTCAKNKDDNKMTIKKAERYSEGTA